MRKRLISYILTLAMVLSLVPAFTATAFATDPDPAPNYLTFTATGGGVTITPKFKSGTWQYSTDGALTWATGTDLTSIDLANGENVKLKGTGCTTDSTHKFVMTGAGKVEASGSVTSLTDGEGNNPNVELTNNCYESMFNECTSLVIAPELPATTLAENCYKDMFGGCTSLVNAPELPATELADWCYDNMFTNCTSLVSAPALNATTLKDGCYAFMFTCCTSLVNAPELKASTLAESCYSGMFLFCTSLFIEETTTSAGCTWAIPNAGTTTAAVNSMVTGTAPGSATVEIPSAPGAVNYYKVSTPNYLTFTAEEADSTVKLTEVGTPSAIDLQYSTTSGIWENYTIGAIINLSSIGDKVQLRATTSNPAVVINYTNYYNFVMTGKIAASGSVTSLTDGVGNNPDIILNKSCYFRLFLNCTSLVSAPELPATTLAVDCYNSMFEGCTSLVSAPELPATTLASHCYETMFKNCKSLINAPALPVKQLEEGCYMNMLQGCTSLVSAPELPATTLTNSCYANMFKDCTSLVSVPELPATTLAAFCYNGMFNGCTSLVSAPELKATTLAERCYFNMFNGCKNLFVEEATEDDYTWAIPNAGTTTGAVSSMVTGTAVGSVKIEIPATPGAVNYYKVRTPNYLTFTAEEANSTVKLTKAGTGKQQISISLQYSTQTDIWVKYTIDSVVTLSAIGDKVQFKATTSNSVFSINNFDYYQFVMTGIIAASGSVTSLTDGVGNNPNVVLTERCYEGMFCGCTSLVSAPVLPATTLADYCYKNMFYDCTSLVSAPELPATTLAAYCYNNMFRGCTSLVSAPELPATTLAASCYQNMFYGCTSLFIEETTTSAGCAWTIPNAGTTTSAVSLMIYGTAKGSVEVTIPAIAGEFKYYKVSTPNYLTFTATGGAVTITPNFKSGEWYYITNGAATWTKGTATGTDINLEAGESVKLSGKNCKTNGTYHFAMTGAGFVEASGSVTSLVDGGGSNSDVELEVNQFGYMFGSCKNLISAPELIAKKLSAECYKGMFYYCTVLTGIPELPATTLADSCYQNMFMGCTSLVSAPELPATTLADSCYRQMFMGCTSLVSVPELKEGTLAKACYYMMFYSCTSLFIEETTTSAGCTWAIPNAGTTTAAVTDMVTSTAKGSVEVTIPAIAGEFKYYKVSTPNYLTFTATGGAVTITPNFKSGEWYYITNGAATWTQGNVTGTAINLEAGESVKLSGKNCKTDSYNHFVMTGDGKVEASGSVTSLTDGGGNNPNVTLVYSCYSYMFEKCTLLVSAPDLPATTLADRCYLYMFSGTALKSAPELPATTLAAACYCSMFSKCEALKTAPRLTAKELKDNCYENMFRGCTSLVNAPELPAKKLAAFCYSGMFSSCTSLVSAPALPATTLKDYCYFELFSGCTSLVNAPELPATTLAAFCYLRMFTRCTSLVSAPALNATMLAEGCYSGMFAGCTSLVNAPELKATTLSDSCYANMFMNCTSLLVKEANSSDYTWAVPNAGTTTSAVSNMVTGTAVGSVEVAIPVSGTNYYKVVKATTQPINNDPEPSYYEPEPTVTVPVSGDKGSVQITITVSGNTTTINNISESQIEKVGTEGNVVIDLSSFSSGITGVILQKTTVENVAKSEADGLEIKLPNGTTAVFDKDTLEAVASQAKGSKIQLVVEKESKAEKTMNDTQKAVVKEMKNAFVIDAYFTSGNENISSFNGGKANISFKYNGSAQFRVWNVAKDGAKTAVPASLKNDIMTITVEHFSHYVVEEITGYEACEKGEACVLAQFTDVDAAKWYHDGIHFCVENGYMSGYGKGLFGPGENLSRGMIVTILYNLEGKPAVAEKSSYTDVAEGKWYADSIAWAEDNSIVSGYGNNLFGPEYDITREELVTIFYTYASYKGYDVSASEDLSAFKDEAEIAKWAVAAFKWAKAETLVSGIGSNTLLPKGTATRAEAATMLKNFCEKFAK